MSDNVTDFIAEFGLELDVEDALFPSLPEPVRQKQFRRKPEDAASITRVYLYRNCTTKQLLTVREIVGDRGYALLSACNAWHNYPLKDGGHAADVNVTILCGDLNAVRFFVDLQSFPAMSSAANRDNSSKSLPPAPSFLNNTQIKDQSSKSSKAPDTSLVPTAKEMSLRGASLSKEASSSKEVSLKAASSRRSSPGSCELSEGSRLKSPVYPKRLAWQDICVTVPMQGAEGKKKKRWWWPRKTSAEKENLLEAGRRVILDNVYGVAQPGELLAIMGGSGAGKTTLMNVFVNIDQTNIERTGHVTVNGDELTPKQMRRISAYVQQVDMFIGTLTVREQLQFSAQLRMAREYGSEERKQKVDEAIRDLNLTNAQNTIIGIPGRVKGISIGEKKRLAFACEILTDPMILFCDEPTSGLDAFMAAQVVTALKDMARKGKTIVTTIHQPSSQVFAMFDKVCFMALGKVAYFGPTSKVTNFWLSVGKELECPQTYNPADHAIMSLSMVDDNKQVNLDRIAKIRTHFENSQLGKNMYKRAHCSTSERSQEFGNDDLKEGSQYAANALVQLKVLFLRALKTTYRDPLLLKVRLIQVFFTAIIIGIVNMPKDWGMWSKYSSHTTTNFEGLLYNCARDMNFMFLFPSINVITSELPIFMREFKACVCSRSGFSWSALGRHLHRLHMPQYTVLPIIYSIIVYWIPGLFVGAGQFLFFTFLNILQCWVAISIAYAGACIFGVDELASTYLPVFILPMLVFGGFYIGFNSIPPYFTWLSWLSWFRYGFEALQINQWRDAEIQCKDGEYCPAHTGRELLQNRDMDVDRLWIDVAALIGIFIIARSIGLLALMARARLSK
ncbi:CRE-WHT-4 protein [Aphelenchoides avenae]|nr:CRE-WHT-4 protein [Aphelenchus avenae]